MNKLNNKTVSIMVVALVGVVGVISSAIYLSSSDKNNNSVQTVASVAVPGNAVDNNQQAYPAKTQKTQVARPVAKAAVKKGHDNNMPDAEEPEVDIFMALEMVDKIKFNEDGSVRVDGDAYYLLRDAWWMLKNNNNSQDLAKVEMLLDAHLPEAQAASTKDMLYKYMEYKSAEEMLVASADGSFDTAARLLERKRELRQSYFGAEVADTLFAEEEKFLTDTIHAIRQQHAEAGVH